MSATALPARAFRRLWSLRSGSQRAALYWFYLAAYRVPLLHLPHPPAVALPLSVGRRWGLSWVQDALAPFVRFVQPRFVLRWASPEPGPPARRLCLRSEVTVAYFGRERLVQQAELVLEDGQLAGLTAQRGGQSVNLIFSVVA